MIEECTSEGDFYAQSQLLDHEIPSSRTTFTQHHRQCLNTTLRCNLDCDLLTHLTSLFDDIFYLIYTSTFMDIIFFSILMLVIISRKFVEVFYALFLEHTVPCSIKLVLYIEMNWMKYCRNIKSRLYLRKLHEINRNKENHFDSLRKSCCGQQTITLQ